MKLVLAALLSISALAAAAPTGARAESSYWDRRHWSDEASRDDRSVIVRHRRVADGDRQRARRTKAERRHRGERHRRYVRRDARVADVVPNPFRVERHDGRAHPTMNNDYWLQQSIYDFQDGKAADLKQYRY